ncbi:F-box/kelch-repeat protein [Senna tora]|uniref:F-box/kelch-repeat protein n=1 Tax=Senna tora TaxID=362788 RepID=A0A834WZL6_9FABA|nr:F-box/kelch-repeat protein [Senna tora]
MEDLFANSAGLPTEIMSQIIGCLGPEEVNRFPYVSKNWIMICKKSYFIDDHSNAYREKNLSHMFFCVPEGNDNVIPFFLQIEPAKDDNNATETFSKIPNFLCHNIPKFIGLDEGVICFRKTLPISDACFFLWNPLTNHSVEVSLSKCIPPGTTIRSGFGFDQHMRGFCIVLFWNSSTQSDTTYMTVFSSYTRSWSKDKTWSVTKVPFPVRELKWHFITMAGCLGITTWRKFLDFVRDYLICVHEDIVGYDDLSTFTQCFTVFENRRDDIIRLVTACTT